MPSKRSDSPPVAQINALRRDVGTFQAIASEAIQAARRANARLDRAARRFNEMTAEVEALALDVADVVKQLRYDALDRGPAAAGRGRGGSRGKGGAS